MRAETATLTRAQLIEAAQAVIDDEGVPPEFAEPMMQAARTVQRVSLGWLSGSGGCGCLVGSAFLVGHPKPWTRLRELPDSVRAAGVRFIYVLEDLGNQLAWEWEVVD